jgi:hypothetical protein
MSQEIPLLYESFDPLNISPETIMEENNSDYARSIREEWEKLYKAHQLLVVFKCSDKRPVLWVPWTMNVSTVAASGDKNLFTEAIAGQRGAIVMGHYDGETLSSTQYPRGCGGRDGKRNIDDLPDGIGHWVKTQVQDPDLITDLMFHGAAVSGLTKKPVYVVAQDHVSGHISPIAVYEDYGRTVTTAKPLRDILQTVRHDDEYNKIYSDGIPELEQDYWSADLALTLSVHADNLHAFQESPEYRQHQKIQVPDVLIMTTDMRPTMVTLPGLAGRAFEVQMPRMDRKDQGIINQRAVELAAEQAQYAIMHAVHNANTRGAEFSRMNTILINTRSQLLNMAVVNTLLQDEFTRKFLQMPGKKILASTFTDGNVRECVELDKATLLSN